MYWPVAKEISFKIFLFLSLVARTELKFPINLGRGHHEDYFFEISLNLHQWFKRSCGHWAVTWFYLDILILMFEYTTYVCETALLKAITLIPVPYQCYIYVHQLYFP